ncbi:MAG TPA: sigma 54-interacting transcriptional regulator [Gallionellaceae bacterium]|nr:sigma 54-interacting transcriptional regulator [Gallionellaceae bacterium]
MNKANFSELQSLIDVQENPFVLIDENYQIVAANRAYCVNYGVDQEKVVGRYCHEISHLSATPCHQNGEDCPHQEVFRTGRMHEVIHTHFDSHNRPEHVRIKGHPIRGANHKLYLGEAVFPIASSDELICKDMQMVGNSPAFLACLDHLTRAAESDAAILLLGESGVGKELAAQYIHQRSSRNKQSLVVLNCASIAVDMFEDELFGHERGAFTGCVGRKQGLFELADNGMLFLDEIGDMPLFMQAKLLRVLESGEFRRIGGTDILRADVRLVSATNNDLLKKVADGEFRHDLYYRIAGIDLHLPSLRERSSDIPALAQAIVKRITRVGKPHCKFTPDALEKLQGYTFPGNIRELKNILLKAVSESNNSIISAANIHLSQQQVKQPDNLRHEIPVETIRQASSNTNPNASIAELEAEHISKLLISYNGHRRYVADTLGISERTLYRKLKRYNLA